MAVTRSQASAEVDALVKDLGIRAHKLKNKELAEAIESVKAMVEYGVVTIDGKRVEYKFEEPLLDGTEKVAFGGKRYTIDEVKSMRGNVKGDDGNLAVIGKMLEPNINVGLLGSLKSDLTDIVQIAALFLPV
jgi:hypothetical protein